MSTLVAPGETRKRGRSLANNQRGNGWPIEERGVELDVPKRSNGFFGCEERRKLVN